MYIHTHVYIRCILLPIRSISGCLWIHDASNTRDKKNKRRAASPPASDPCGAPYGLHLEPKLGWQTEARCSYLSSLKQNRKCHIQFSVCFLVFPLPSPHGLGRHHLWSPSAPRWRCSLRSARCGPEMLRGRWHWAYTLIFMHIPERERHPTLIMCPPRERLDLARIKNRLKQCFHGY